MENKQSVTISKEFIDAIKKGLQPHLAKIVYLALNYVILSTVALHG